MAVINSDNTTDICQWYESLEPALEDLCASQLVDAWQAWCDLEGDNSRQLVALCLMSGTDLADVAMDVLTSCGHIDGLWEEIGCITDLGGNCGMSHEIAGYHALESIEYALENYACGLNYSMPDIQLAQIEDKLGYMAEFDAYVEATAEACETPEAVEIDGTTLRVTIHPSSEVAALWGNCDVGKACGALMQAIAKIEVTATTEKV